jgi:hypothetical protein
MRVRATAGACNCKTARWQVEVHFPGEHEGIGGNDLAINALGLAAAMTVGIGFRTGRGEAEPIRHFLDGYGR